MSEYGKYEYVRKLIPRLFSYQASGSDVTLPSYTLSAGNSGQHRWYYFPAMTRDEVVLHKQFDSDTTRTARNCFHTSCKDPAAPEDIPPRQSIELRAMVYFPDHRPNTCPGL